MKTKIIFTALAFAVIASFSFITISKDINKKSEKTEVNVSTEYQSGFSLSDEDQF